MADRYATLVPRVRESVRHPGVFELGPETVVAAAPGAEEAAQVVRLLLAPLRLPLLPGPDGADAVRVRLDPDEPEPEGYRLRIGADGVTITARGLDGVRHAVHVLLQLLPDDVWRAAPRPGTRWLVECGEIADAPALAWRGGMLDVARHFLPKRAVLRYVDLLAMHRCNRLHLHLTNDQGWRVESRRHPELTRIGGHRPQTRLGVEMPGFDPPEGDQTPHGGCYTLDDLAEITAYAAERGVTVVPEISVPAHASALLAAHPEFGIGEHTVLTAGGISSGVLKPLPATVEFVASVLDEVLAAVPTPYVHLGGDEAILDGWARDPEVASYQRQLGFSKPAELHGHFLRQLGTFLAGRGRRMAVWDEAFVTGGVLEDTVVLAWRGDAVARRAAAAGHDVVRCPVYPTYLDYRQSDRQDEPLSLGGPITLADSAGFTPRPPEWSDAEAARVIGAQFQAWSEFIPHERHLDYMVFPRACAVAEVAWTGAPADTDELTQRLRTHLSRLDAAGVEYRPLDGPHPWQTGGTGPRRWQRGVPIAVVRQYLESASTSGEVQRTHVEDVLEKLADHD